VRLVVGANNVVDTLRITVRLSVGLSTCTGPLVLQTAVPIQGGRFTAQTTFVGSSVQSTATGTFASPQSIGGTFEGYSGSFSLVCGSSFIIGSGSPLSSGTWQATKN
jgi:hypothetical protein